MKKIISVPNAINILILFHPRKEGLIKYENKEPRPPIVPNKNKIKIINEIRFVNGGPFVLPDKLEKTRKKAKTNPKAPKMPSVEVIFSLTRGVDPEYSEFMWANLSMR